TFSGLLKEMWKVLYDEYSSSGDYFQVRRRLMVIRMASGDYSNIISRYEDFCDEFINLAEQLLDDDDLSEKAYRKEIVGYFLHGLDPAVTRRIERDYEPEELEVISFNTLKHKARSICRYLASKTPSTSTSYGTTAVNNQVNTISTTAPGLDSGERCDKCGLYHPTAEEKMRCKARDSSQLICVRCRKIGHLARACPANFADPLPKEERNKIYQNAKNGRNLYDAARATPDGKVAEKVAPAAGKSAGMAVVETKPIPQEGDTLDVGLLSAAAVQGLRYIDVRLEFPDRRSHSYNEVWEQALIDSGADACFAGEALAKDIESHGGDYIRTLPRSITVTLANGAKTRPVGYVSGVNVWLNDAHKVEIDRIYIMPVVGGSMRGIIIPYSLLGGLTVSWTLTPEGETTVVLGETARLIYDYSKAVAGSQPRCTVAIQNRDEGRDSPIHCSVIDTVEPNGSSKNDDIKTVVPLRLIPDEDAIDGRPTVGIPWRRRDKRPPPNFKTCYVRDKRTFERLDEEQIKQCLGAFQVFTDRKYVLPTLPSAQVSKETCYPKNDDELFDGDRHAECLTKRFIPMFPVWDRVSVSTKYDGKLLPDLAHFVPTKGSEEGEWMPTGEKPNWNMSPEELLNLLAYYVDDWCIGGMFPLE
ncbi:hypothetical protein FOL46_001890, partial [Perkinsus olseni]